MSHISVKVRLEGGMFPTAQLAGWFGFEAEGRAQRHRDSIYKLGTDRLLKIRDYPDQPSEVILEGVIREGGTRHSKISVGTLREGPRDSSPQDVLGEAAVTIDKTRQVFTIPDYPSIRIYADTLGNGDRFLEFQMDIDGADRKAAIRDLKNIVVSYGFAREKIIEQSYEGLYTNPLFEEATEYTEAYSYAAPELQSAIRQSAQIKPKGEGFLMKKGDEGTTALLITQGRAYIGEDGVVLKPGQLVGEFAAFTNGRRAANVVTSADFEGHIISPQLLPRLMAEIPANAGKFFAWSAAKAASFTP